MSQIREAARKYEEPTFAPIDKMNAARVLLVVKPGSSIDRLDTIENVVIKRGDLVTKPLTAKVSPVVLENRMGAKVPSAEGLFVFDYATSAPDSDITIVMIGKLKNFEWRMTPDELRGLVEFSCFRLVSVLV